jgi:hypothetical protein
MRAIAIFGLTVLATLGATVGGSAMAHPAAVPHRSTVADTGWGDPCSAYNPSDPRPCRTAGVLRSPGSSNSL